MKLRHLFLILFLWGNICSLFPQENARLNFTFVTPNELTIVTQAQFHQQYGLTYPITYQIDFASGLTGLKVNEKHLLSEPWVLVPEKNPGDLFDAIEAVRFDYATHTAYISASFNSQSDSLFLELVDSLNNPVTFSYGGISKYYDNRKAVVTISSDDWSDFNAVNISPIMYLFRSRGLYLTAGIITDPQYCSGVTWNPLQSELDSGYVEAASHSRTHPPTPYSNPVSEIIGSEQDIKQHLVLPSLFSSNGTEYIYTWIAPYGDYDYTVDSLLGVGGYLDARLYANLDTTSPRIYYYGDSTLTNWDDTSNHFDPFFPTVELGAPSWGGGDTSLASLNRLFDNIVSTGDVYHLMFHPQVIISDKDKGYLINHLNYISGRSNIWYVNLGHLYLYHLLQEANLGNSVTAVSSNGNYSLSSFKLSQNYPNPFNPSTIINYEIPTSSLVTLKVYDLLGREVTTLVNEIKPAGKYNITFDASKYSSGVYFYRIEAGEFSQIKKMVLLK